LTEADREGCYVESTLPAHRIKSDRRSLAANPLHPTSMATSIRVRNGERFVAGGPFAETHEQLGGCFLIETKDLDEAIDIAARIPMARKGTVEIRPVAEIVGLPES